MQRNAICMCMLMATYIRAKAIMILAAWQLEIYISIIAMQT